MINVQEVHQPDREARSCLSLLGIGVLIPLGFIIAYFILWAAGAFLVIADPQKKVDAAVALSGGELDRVREAARLYTEQTARWVILTETGEEVPELGEQYFILRKNEALKSGVPGDAILVTDHTVTSTLDEAQAVRELLQKTGLSSCIVITDPFHSFRTRLIFRDEFDETGLTVRVRPVRDHWYRSRTWMFSRAGWEATVLEYAKLFGYFLGVKDDGFI